MRRLPDNRLDRALDETARTAARLIRSTADPTYTAARFLLLFADSLQDRKSDALQPRTRPVRVTIGL